MDKITAVVVTYNRLKYLKKCVEALRSQTIKLDGIIVVNNDSNDGTKEWLDCQADLTVFHQANVGGAGGFARGIDEAYKVGYEYIWTMDDDVNPSPSCLERLLSVAQSDEKIGIVCPSRVMNGKIAFGETLRFNLSNPFAPLKRVLSNADLTSDVIDIESMAFEGPFIKRNVVEKIGLPNEGLFIFWDDTDYSYRCILSGSRVVYVPSAILNKEDLSSGNQATLRSWKTPYGLRNLVYFTHKYGKNGLFRSLFPRFVLLRYFLGWLRHTIRHDGYYNLNDIQMIYRSYLSGIKGTLGKILQ